MNAILDNELEKARELFGLPPIPTSKRFETGKIISAEADLILKFSDVLFKPSTSDLNILQECITFYRTVFPAFRKIDFGTTTQQDLTFLKRYADLVFEVNFLFHNQLELSPLYRVTIIKDDWRTNGRIKDFKYVRYPDLEVMKSLNLYNRCSSPEQTVFYASLKKYAAFLEIKPRQGQIILFSKWEPKANVSFSYYPVTNAGIRNSLVENSTKAFKDVLEKRHPLFVELAHLISEFFARELVKDCPILSKNRFEYFFSGYVSDRILFKRVPNQTDWFYDLIIYPSIAVQYGTENIAMRPDSLDEKMNLKELIEFEVVETFYEPDFGGQPGPASLRKIRTMKQKQGSLLVWDDEQ